MRGPEDFALHGIDEDEGTSERLASIYEALVQVVFGIHDLHAALAEHANAGQAAPEPVRWVKLSHRCQEQRFRADQIESVSDVFGRTMVGIRSVAFYPVDQTVEQVRAAIDRAKAGQP